MEKLGINPFLIVVQIINFGLLLFLLKKVLYKPVLKAIKDREDKIASIDKEKRAVADARSEFEDDKSKLLKSIGDDKKKILDDAKKEAEEKSKDIIEEANKKAKDIVRQADMEADRQVKKLRDELDKKALDMSMAIIKKASSNLLSESAQKESMDLAIKKLAKINGK